MSETTFTRHLRVLFTKEELAEFNNNLSESVTALEMAESEKKHVMSSLNAKVEAAKSAILHTNCKIKDKSEYRMVKCEQRNLNFKKNTKDIVRLDTNEVIETVALTEDDRQIKLKLEKSKEKPEKKSEKKPVEKDVKKPEKKKETAKK